MPEHQKRPLLGISFMLVFCLFAPLSDSIAKLLSWLPLLILVATRMIFQSALLALTGASLSGLPRQAILLLVLRAFLHLMGMWLMFVSLQTLPLGDAIAIAYVMPFIMLFLGHYILGEEMGWHRITSAAFGFLGVLLVIKPNFTAFGFVALLPLAVAFIFAGFSLITRVLTRHATPLKLHGLSGGIALLFLLPLLALHASAESPSLLRALSAKEGALLILLGITGNLAHLGLTYALRYAPTATLAPMQYLEIPLATLIGYLIFKEFPDGLALLGIGMIISAGLYIIHREIRHS